MKRQRSSNVSSGLAMKAVSASIYATSANSSYKNSDGSTFRISMERAQLYIPSHATNVTAKLVQAMLINGSSPVNPILLETNFTQGGVNTKSEVSQVLAAIIHSASSEGEKIIYEATNPVPIPCTHAIKGTNPMELEFRLTDINRNSVAMSDDWFIQILVEWEQEQPTDQLRASELETQYY
jgi:hypothetical protein